MPPIIHGGPSATSITLPPCTHQSNDAGLQALPQHVRAVKSTIDFSNIWLICHRILTLLVRTMLQTEVEHWGTTHRQHTRSARECDIARSNDGFLLLLHPTTSPSYMTYQLQYHTTTSPLKFSFSALMQFVGNRKGQKLAPIMSKDPRNGNSKNEGPPSKN